MTTPAQIYAVGRRAQEEAQGAKDGTPAVSIIAIDPGPVKSAFCLYEEAVGLVVADTQPNEQVMKLLRDTQFGGHWRLVIEKIACYGMAVGEEVFETCVWTGRFIQTWEARSFGANGKPARITRLDVKTHLCHSARAGDPNVRQALIDRFGGPEALAKSKRCPKCKGEGGARKADGWHDCPNIACRGGRIGNNGLLTGIVGDQWAALAVALTYADRVAGGYAG